MNSTRMIKFMALLGLLCALTGCSEDGVVEICKKCPPDKPHLPFPSTKAQLMANFVTVYEDMNYQEYRNLLTHDFQLTLQQSTIDDFPQVGPKLDYDEEMAIHARMFAGEDFDNGSGQQVLGVASVSIGEFRQLGEWVPTLQSVEIPNSETGTFQIEMTFVQSDQVAPTIRGHLKFYVVGQDSVVAGVTTKYYQMAGQNDETLGDKRPIVNTLFGSWLALFD